MGSRHFGEVEVFIVQVVNEQNATLVLFLLILDDEKIYGVPSFLKCMSCF